MLHDSSDPLLLLLSDPRQWRTAAIMGFCGCVACFFSFALIFNGVVSINSLIWNSIFCSLICCVAASICVGPLGGHRLIAVGSFVAPFLGLIFLAAKNAPFSREVLIDCYIPALFAVLAAYSGARVGMADRKEPTTCEPGVCSRCGYDLRATPDRCPECGTVPSPKPLEPADQPPQSK